MTDDMRREGGFTLVELLTVIVIIGVLAAVAIPTFLNQKEKGLRATAVSDLRSVFTAQSTLVVDDTGYTEDLAVLEGHGYKRSASIEELVIAVQDSEYLACAKPQAVDEWLVLDSTTQAMSWSSDNDCA